MKTDKYMKALARVERVRGERRDANELRGVVQALAMQAVYAPAERPGGPLDDEEGPWRYVRPDDTTAGPFTSMEAAFREASRFYTHTFMRATR